MQGWEARYSAAPMLTLAVCWWLLDNWIASLIFVYLGLLPIYLYLKE